MPRGKRGRNRKHGKSTECFQKGMEAERSERQMNEFYRPRSMKKAFCCWKGKNAFLAAAQHLGDSFSPSSNASICSVFLWKKKQSCSSQVIKKRKGKSFPDSLWLANSAILDELNLKEHCIFDARRMAKDFTAIVIFLNLLIVVLGLGLADLFQS